MSYEPTQWKAGDIVTSAKLNKLEQGVANGGGILIAHMIVGEENPPTLDKTWQEIYDGGFGIIVGEQNGAIFYCPIIQIYEFGIITLMNIGPETLGTATFTAESADDYPIMTHSGGGR